MTTKAVDDVELVFCWCRAGGEVHERVKNVWSCKGFVEFLVLLEQN